MNMITLNNNIQMPKTQYRGLDQVSDCVKLKFAAMNLKKLATWRWRDFILLLFWPLCARNPAHA